MSLTEDYYSHNTERLDIMGMQALLRKLDFIRALEQASNIEPEH